MSQEIGTLVVVVLKARNLQDKHFLYKQDVFAQVTLNGTTKKTRVEERGGQHPVWDEELRLPVFNSSSEQHRSLQVSCWSKEPRVDELLCQGKVDISETLRTGEFDDWVQLEHDGAYRGELYLEMTFYAAGPPPLQRRASKLTPSDRLAAPIRPYAYPHPSSKTPPGSSPLRTPHSSTHPDQHHVSNVPTSPTGTHLAPPGPSSTHSSPRNRDDPLPPLPAEPETIPAILRAGRPHTSPQSDPRPLPPNHPLHTRYPSPPRSPPHNAVPMLSRNPQSASERIVPPASLRPGAPFVPPEPRPYPYNYPPLPPDPDLPDPYLIARYKMPLPLPDEPEGSCTPTPANPRPYLRAAAPAPARHPAQGHAKTPVGKSAIGCSRWRSSGGGGAPEAGCGARGTGPRVSAEVGP
ncbi:Ingression protein fic1 [Grifola frondosa]|uniref:Ingression protein fic1 n=1 Tax=Grifola frondosa TaxID=5627 RepID=A0A1C7MCD2_GRIFR|nr:Ingression protein fic1 [Grifola frondosa]